MSPLYILRHSVWIKHFLYRLYYLWPWRKRSSVGTWINYALRHGCRTCMYVGANDGLAGNVAHEFVFTKKMICLFIEPVPRVFARLQRLYRHVGHACCWNFCMVVNRKPAYQNEARGKSCQSYTNGFDNGAERVSFYHLRNGRRAGYDQVGSMSYIQVAKHQHTYGGYMERIEVPTICLEEAFDAFMIPDILIVDAEGMDEAIIHRLLNMYAEGVVHCLPDLIVFEHAFIKNVFSYEWLARLLRQNGFNVMKYAGDTVAVRVDSDFNKHGWAVKAELEMRGQT